MFGTTFRMMFGATFHTILPHVMFGGLVCATTAACSSPQTIATKDPATNAMATKGLDYPVVGPMDHPPELRLAP